MARFKGYRVALVVWMLALITILIWMSIPGYVVGGDLHVYEAAMRSLRAGRDPYVDGIAVQRAFHALITKNLDAQPPYTYVYSPMTLPLLRWICLWPGWLSGGMYWALYVGGALGAIWVGMQAVEVKERRMFAIVAPVAIFFPGLLMNDCLFSGNVAYIWYGLIFGAALWGWRRGQWGWFYAGVLAASCWKAPWLSLLAIPVLSARRQWVAAGVTGVAGVALFAVQPLLWPAGFHNYLEAVELQFSFNHDFGISPAGMLGHVLYRAGVPYSPDTGIFYVAYALAISGMLLYLSRRFFAGEISLKQWIPILLVGVILLNPRIMEYDVAPIMVPMALIAWRLCSARSRPMGMIVGVSVFIAAMNGLATGFDNTFWRAAECVLLVGLFAAGSWNLVDEIGGERRRLAGVRVEYLEPGLGLVAKVDGLVEIPAGL